MNLFLWRKKSVRKLYSSLSLFLIFFLTFQGLFPHIDVLAANYRQSQISLSLSEIIGENLPDHPRIKLIAQILDLLPAEHYQSLLQIDYNPQYTNYPRGMAKEDHLILNVFQMKNDEELVSVFIHEMGHVADLGFLTDLSPAPLPSEFRYGPYTVTRFDPSRQFYRISWLDAQNISQDQNTDDFVSTYGMTNPFEDFAESYNFFVLHRENFLQRTEKSPSLKQKWDFLHRRVFFGQSYDFYSSENYPKLIYDTTLLPFDLKKLVLYIEDRDDRRRLFGRTNLRRTARRIRKPLV